MTAGMCSEIERADSFLSSPFQSTETEMIDGMKNATTYISNCTNKLITGLRDTFQRCRRGRERIGFRNYAEFLWLKEILQMLCSFCIAVVVSCLVIQSSKTARL